MAVKAIEAAKLAITMEGEKAFELHGNLLSYKARWHWEKIIKVQVIRTPWEDMNRVMHTKTPTIMWNSSCNCVVFHLQQVFRYNVGETLKYYVMNTLKKPNRV